MRPVSAAKGYLPGVYQVDGGKHASRSAVMRRVRQPLALAGQTFMVCHLLNVGSNAQVLRTRMNCNSIAWQNKGTKFSILNLLLRS